MYFCTFFFTGCYDHRDLHVLTHSFPTRRSSVLVRAPGRRGRSPAPLDARRLTAADASTQLPAARLIRSEEHTSELQSLMRISYAVFCLKKKTIEVSALEYRCVAKSLTHAIISCLDNTILHRGHHFHDDNT